MAEGKSTRAGMRGKPLEKERRRAKVSRFERGMDDDRAFCCGLADPIDLHGDLSGMVRYRFPPPNRKARAASLREQSCKAMEEADEIRRAIEDGESDSRILEETWDCIHACEGILRKFGESAVLSALATTVSKCERRGDYDEDQSEERGPD